MLLLRKLSRQIRRWTMAKNRKQHGRSVRNGNSPSPYKKYNKTPCRYSQDYYDWRRQAMGNKPKKATATTGKREYQIAAE